MAVVRQQWNTLNSKLSHFHAITVCKAAAHSMTDVVSQLRVSLVSVVAVAVAVVSLAVDTSRFFSLVLGRVVAVAVGSVVHVDSVSSLFSDGKGRNCIKVILYAFTRIDPGCSGSSLFSWSHRVRARYTCPSFCSEENPRIAPNSLRPPFNSTTTYSPIPFRNSLKAVSQTLGHEASRVRFNFLSIP